MGVNQSFLFLGSCLLITSFSVLCLTTRIITVSETTLPTDVLTKCLSQQGDTVNPVTLNSCLKDAK